jgi:outer membrane receptor protein involved in Fe transport
MQRLAVWLAAQSILPALAALGAAGQEPVRVGPGRISGRVEVHTTAQPLAAASIAIRSAGDSAVIGRSTTSADGSFAVDGLALGSYVVHVTHLGYTPHVREGVTLTASSPALDLGVIELEVAPVSLEEIQAHGARAPVVLETDRTVYSAGDLPASSGGTATDLLRQISELEVDVNGKVSLRGNQPVSIHLNGRPAPLRGEALENFLQQMPANRIASVEVMPNPTARHDPEGTGGIVNLILVDDADLGLSGNLSGNASSRGSRGFNGRLNYQRGRLTFFGGAGLNFHDSRRSTSDVRQNLLTNPITLLEQEGSVAFDNTFNMLDLSTELRTGEQSIAWLNVTLYGGGQNNGGSTLYGLYDNDRLLLDLYDRRTNGESDLGSSDVAVGFKHSFEPQRHELTIDLRRNGWANDGTSVIEKLSRMEDPQLAGETMSTDNRYDNTGVTLRADYNRSWGEKGRIEAGLNASSRTLDDDQLQQVVPSANTAPGTRLESHYTHDENFLSGYVTVGQTYGKFGLQLGLRAELAETDFTLRTTDESFDNDYRTIYPSFNVSFDGGNGRTIRVSYSKRVSRPYAGLLNPYVLSTDPLNRWVGNPYLDPSYTHSFSLDISRIGRKGTLRLAPTYSRTVNGWESIKRVDDDGVSTVRYENTASNESFGTTLTASLSPVGRMSGSATFGVYRSVTNASNISTELSSSAFHWSARVNATSSITSSLNAQVNANYMPARLTPQGRISAMFMSMLGLRQQFFNEKATLSLNVTDPLGLYEYTFETRDRTHVQSSRTAFTMRAVTLSLTYNFGRPPEQTSRREGPVTATDEQVRIR